MVRLSIPCMRKKIDTTRTSPERTMPSAKQVSESANMTNKVDVTYTEDWTVTVYLLSVYADAAMMTSRYLYCSHKHRRKRFFFSHRFDSLPSSGGHGCHSVQAHGGFCQSSIWPPAARQSRCQQRSTRRGRQFNAIEH